MDAAWIVVSMRKQPGSDAPADSTEEWSHFEEEGEARDAYRALLDDRRTYTASLCRVVASTDYDALEG